MAAGLTQNSANVQMSATKQASSPTAEERN